MIRKMFPDVDLSRRLQKNLFSAEKLKMRDL